MVILKLRGSLGNQLFSYCFGRRIAIEKRDILIVDKWPIYEYTAQSYYSLNRFNIKGLELPFKSKYITSFLNRLDNENTRTISKVNFTKIYEPQIIEDCLNTKNLILDGHWQSYKYFEKYWEILKRDLTLKKSNLTFDQMRNLEEMKQSNSISIHIRRGDYLKSKDLKPLPIDYYREAIKISRKKINKPKFFVFSDDQEWVRKNLEIEDAVYPSQNIENPENDLIMMSQAKHNIIANSTFSWWGGYLNKFEDKIIIAPNDWFTSKKRNNYISDLLPQKWIKI